MVESAIMAVKRPPTQQLQKESFIAVDSVCNQMNCEFRRHEPDNAGIDGEIDLVKATAFEGKLVKTQVKAGSSYITAENENHVRVKVERRYVELWNVMNVPVVLIFYHPDTKVLYWKAVKPYLKCDPNVLKRPTQNVIFQFDKARDIFTPDVLNSLRAVVEGTLEYQKIIYTEDNREEVISNWFPVIQLPKTIYLAPTLNRRPKDITVHIRNYYTFTIYDRKLYTFSDLHSPECELRDHCDVDEIKTKTVNQLQEPRYMELLNRMLLIFAWQHRMFVYNDRFIFSSRNLQEGGENKFDFKPLKRDIESSRSKIYINKIGNLIEYKHMAVKLCFIKLGSKWYFQIEPEWHFSYPYDETKTKKDIGIRITREKANTFNEHYLYLLHAWKQFLSHSSDQILFPVDELPNSQMAIISTVNETFISNFMLFNDYIGPKVEQ
jgi:hypothetical protein